MRIRWGWMAVLVLFPVVALAQEDKPVSVEQASKMVNKDATVEFVVKGTGKTRAGDKVFLNSEADYKSEKNFTVVLPKSVLTKLKEKAITDPVAHFKGKKVQVYGTIKLFMDRAQIVVEKPEQITEVASRD